MVSLVGNDVKRANPTSMIGRDLDNEKRSDIHHKGNPLAAEKRLMSPSPLEATSDTDPGMPDISSTRNASTKGMMLDIF